MIDAMFFDFERYDFGDVGRYRLNQRLELDFPNTEEYRVLRREDLIGIIKEIIKLNNDPSAQASLPRWPATAGHANSTARHHKSNPVFPYR